MSADPLDDARFVGYPGFDPSFRAVEREAYAVEREARALEREAGGAPFVQPTVQGLLTAALNILEPDRRRAPIVERTWEDFLIAYRILMDLCQALEEERLDERRRIYLTEEIRPALVALGEKIDAWPAPQPVPPPAPPPPRGRRT